MDDEHTMGVQPLSGAAIGGVRIRVRPEDFARATETLAAVVEHPLIDPPQQ